MNNTNNPEKDEQPKIPASIRLALIASLIAAIEDVFVIMSLLESLEEIKVAEEKEKQAEKEMEDKFQRMQMQIDELANELYKIKYRGY